MPTITSVYTKNGGIFSSSREANQDRLRLVSSGLLQQFADVHDELQHDNVLHGNIQISWDQDAFAITVTKNVSDVSAYYAKFIWSDEIARLAEEANWTVVTEVSE